MTVFRVLCFVAAMSVAAMSVAAGGVAEEMDVQRGGEVGCSMRFGECASGRVPLE